MWVLRAGLLMLLRVRVSVFRTYKLNWFKDHYYILYLEHLGCMIRTVIWHALDQPDLRKDSQVGYTV